MTIVSNVKEIADLVKKLGDVELYRKIVELEGEVIELTRDNHELERKVDDLSKKLSMAATLIWHSGYYWRENDQFPFCPRCWEKEHIAVHLVGSGKIVNPWSCPNCKSNFTAHAQHP